MRKSIVFAAAPFALAVLARTASAGCLKDADCKGDRICSSGKCVEPQTEETDAPVRRRAATAKAASSQDAWYGWQILVCDGAAFAVGLIGAGMFVAGHDGGDGALAGTGFVLIATGLAGYAFASPIVHWIHGNVFGGIGSVMGRLAMIGLGVGLTFATVDEYGTATATGPAIAGVAMVGGSILDAIFNSRERSAGPHAGMMMPWVGPVRFGGGVSAGLVGSF
jgi:hypothetical protein